MFLKVWDHFIIYISFKIDQLVFTVDYFINSIVLVPNYILFIQVAMKWPTLMHQWEIMEHKTKTFENPPYTDFKTKMIICVVMISSTGMF